MLIILKTTVISFNYHEPKTQNTAFDILAILLKSHVCYLNKWTGAFTMKPDLLASQVRFTLVCTNPGF